MTGHFFCQHYFFQFIQFKTASGLSRATIDSYTFALRDYMHFISAIKEYAKDYANDSAVVDYFASIAKKGYAQATLRDKYIAIKCYYQWAHDTYGLQMPIMPKKPPLPKNKARCFTDEEISTILNYLNKRKSESFTGLRDYTIVCMLLGTGIRRAELLGITHINKYYITVCGKGKKIRQVPIAAALRSVLNTYVIERNKIAVCDKLIVTQDGRPMTVNGLRAVFTRLSKNTCIGGRRFSAHTFRHTYATSFLKNNGDLASLQQILGHADIATTSVYLHWNDETAKMANEKANPLNNFKIFF